MNTSNEKPKIAYIISCLDVNTGQGGHYHSLRSTAEFVGESFDIKIFIIGNNTCLPIENSGLPFEKIPHKYNFYKSSKVLKKKIMEGGFTVVHSFDIKADLFARIVSTKLKLPKINTKCGGKSPSKFYPFQKNLIIYSGEDLNYFSNEKKFADSNIYLIPNRTRSIQNDDARIQGLKQQSEGKLVLMRICRIGAYYKKTLIQTVNLYNELKKRGISLELFIIGKLESQEILDELKTLVEGDKDAKFITDNHYTSSASQLVDFADMVVGTGRSFMEAASKGKIMLTPTKGSQFPALVDSNNFDSFFNSNFSERNYFKDFNEENNLKKIAEILTDEAKLKSGKEFSTKMFDLHFNLETQREKYADIYNNILYSKEPSSDILLHKLRMIKFYLK